MLAGTAEMTNVGTQFIKMQTMREATKGICAFMMLHSYNRQNKLNNSETYGITFVKNSAEKMLRAAFQC